MSVDRTRRQYLRRLGSAGLAAVTVSLAGCTGGGGSDTDDSNGSGGTTTVDMTDELTFEPAEIEISVGTTVVWENVGTIGHTVTAYEDKIPEEADYFASGGFDSEAAAQDGYPDQGNIPEGESYEHTFDTAGDYGYYCIPHEMNGMVGTIHVT